MTHDHTRLLLRLHPRGAADLRPGGTYYLDLEVFGEVLDTVFTQAVELEDELLPDRSSALLSRWEAAYDIRRVSGRTDAERREVIIARRRHLPDFRPTTIDDIITTHFGLDVDVVEPMAFRCDDPASLCDSESHLCDGHLIFFIEFDEATARTLGIDRDEMDFEIGRIKPAHVIGHTRCDDFRCDDPFSLLDLDLLGA